MYFLVLNLPVLDFILYPMLLTKFSVASTAIEIGNLSMGENLIMVSA